ncbi:hypothetical protein AAVH_31990 [Aphelenchoides avenae]|nr:hypothetical protein AAVH_31990 [Aphelenchus avenae]
MSTISNAFSRSFSDDADRLSLGSNENSNDSWTSSSVPNCSPSRLQQMVEAALDAQREYRAAVERRKHAERYHDKRADTAEFHKALDAALCVHPHAHHHLPGHRH